MERFRCIFLKDDVIEMDLIYNLSKSVYLFMRLVLVCNRHVGGFLNWNYFSTSKIEDKTLRHDDYNDLMNAS